MDRSNLVAIARFPGCVIGTAAAESNARARGLRKISFGHVMCLNYL